MRTITAIFLVVVMAASAVADDAAWRFRRLKKGADVHVVLRSGGECDGKVTERREPMVTVRVTKDRQACGGKETLTLDTTKISAADAELVDPPARRELGAAAAATGVSAATIIGSVAAGSALAGKGHPALATGVGLAGLLAAPLLVRMMTRRSDKQRQRFVLYVNEE